MQRDIHDIYDVIMKIIIIFYGIIFLNFIGIDKKIVKILNTEFVTLKGRKYYLDFLCLLEDGTLCHIEFQFPKAFPDDLDRFYDYNIIARIRYDTVVETMVINFTSRRLAEKARAIGESVSFHPKYFYLGDIDFAEYWENIHIKAETNVKLTGFEEIVMMVTCLVPECRNKAKILDRISVLLKNRNLFDESRFDCIQSVIKLEIDNLLSEDEQEEISEEIDMSPEAQQIITQMIGEVNKKVLYETEYEARNEGRKEAIEEMAKNLKDVLDEEEISKCTGLSVEEIRAL